MFDDILMILFSIIIYQRLYNYSFSFFLWGLSMFWKVQYNLHILFNSHSDKYREASKYARCMDNTELDGIDLKLK